MYRQIERVLKAGTPYHKSQINPIFYELFCNDIVCESALVYNVRKELLSPNYNNMTTNTEEKDVKVNEADKAVSEKGKETGAAHADASEAHTDAAEGHVEAAKELEKSK